MFKMGNKRILFTLVLYLVLAGILEQTYAATTTTKAPDTSKSPTTSTATNTSAVTTAASTAAPVTTPSPTSTATTTTTTTTVATTTAAPVLDGDCSGKPDNWCNAAIVGVAVCDNGTCACALGHFQTNSTTCVPESDLVPASLSFPGITDNSLQVNWTLSPSVVNLNLTYTISAISVDNASLPTVPCAQSGSTLAAVCSSLTPGHKYNVTVLVEYDTKSAAKTDATAIKPAIPGALVDNLNYTAPDVHLRWTPSTGRVQQYEVQISGNQIYNVQEPSLDVTGLVASVNYTVVLFAKSHGKSSDIRYASFKTYTAVPSPPRNIMVENTTVTVNSITLIWMDPQFPNGDILYYEICYNYKVYNDLTDYINGSCTNTTGPVNRYTVQDLPKPGAHYVFTMKTVNNMYMSESTTPTSGRTLFQMPGKVENLDGESANDSIQVTWMRPSKPNGDIYLYKIEWKNDLKDCVVHLRAPDSPFVTDELCGSPSPPSPISIAVNQKNLTYTIRGLKPYTLYNITVRAYTSSGAGEPDSIVKQTSITKPDDVQNVTVSNITSTTVTVHWIIPSVNPGPVNYTAVAVDKVQAGENEMAHCLSLGYNSSSCVIEGLEEFWKYSVYVVGETASGFSENVYAPDFTTIEGMPGQVSSISYMVYDDTANRQTCDATKVNISWTEPVLKQRNANITKYKLSIANINGYPKEIAVENPDPYSITNRDFHHVITALQAETSYTVEISAIGSITGNPDTKGFATKACAPPKWNNATYGIIQMGSNTPDQVTVKLSTTLYKDNTQGDIIDKGLIIAKDRNFVETLQNSLSGNDLRLNNWQTSSSDGYKEPYKILVSNDDIAGSDLYKVIGTTSNCASVQESFCNGYLPNDFQIWVSAFACTRVSCTWSIGFGPFRTQPKPDETTTSNTGLIIGICFLLVVVFAAGAFGLLWFRGVIDPRAWFGGKGDDEEGEFLGPVVEIQKNRPISIKVYNSRLEELHRDTNLLLSDQYDDIKKLSQQIEEYTTTDNANLEPNKPKNRWVNILPYDHSRVKLQQIDDDDPTSDYINANYMPGFNKTREYIATQGPLPGTIDDFWRMIWEHQVMVIAMLTQCKEGSRVKCEMYWPDVVREPKQYGEVVVNPISISQIDKYNINIFELSVDNQTRQVIHFHYLDFPDFSANVEFDHFINFVRTVRNHVPHGMTGPMVIHCSAGVGRTGTFIAVDRLNEYLNSKQFSFDDKVDIFTIVFSLRENRVSMVQTESQFIMIHDCFEKMLQDKKKSLETTESQEDLYQNQGFDPYPEVQYENVAFASQMKTEL